VDDTPRGTNRCQFLLRVGDVSDRVSWEICIVSSFASLDVRQVSLFGQVKRTNRDAVSNVKIVKFTYFQKLEESTRRKLAKRNQIN
jgi:hypothetical protein